MVREIRSANDLPPRPRPGALPVGLGSPEPAAGGMEAGLAIADRKAKRRRISPGLSRQVSAKVPIEISNELEAWCGERGTTRAEYLRELVMAAAKLIRHRRNPLETLRSAARVSGDC
jgi:hypothetical protein